MALELPSNCSNQTIPNGTDCQALKRRALNWFQFHSKKLEENWQKRMQICLVLRSLLSIAILSGVASFSPSVSISVLPSKFPRLGLISLRAEANRGSSDFSDRGNDETSKRNPGDDIPQAVKRYRNIFLVE